MAESKKIILDNRYVVPYAHNFSDLAWYEKDLIDYFNYRDYKEMVNNLTYYFSKKKWLILILFTKNAVVINYKVHIKIIRVKSGDFKNFPEND